MNKKKFSTSIFAITTLTVFGAGLGWAGPGWQNGGGPGRMGFGVNSGTGFLNPGTGFQGGHWQDGPWQDIGPNFRGGIGQQAYPDFTVQTDEDVFVNAERFQQATGLNFVDDNGDGICDYVQDTDLYRQQFGDRWQDTNQDGIGDLFQTWPMYQRLGMGNFVDVDGDGLCDNYELFPAGPTEPGNFRGGYGPQFYQGFGTSTDNDFFVNPERFRQFSGQNFVDENNDGICDYVQDSDYFKQLGVGPWVDENGDSIADFFQGREIYWALGMKNYIDVDGDGLCDNYEEKPFADQPQDQ